MWLARESAATPFSSTVAPPSAAGAAADVSFKVDPYGLIIAEAAYLLGGSSNNPDVPQWSVNGDSAFYSTARQSRFGVRASWHAPPGRLGVENVYGLVEADFYGAFVGQGIGYFLPLPRLRLATATAEWSSVRFSFGQDWSVMAPINPVAAFHTAVPGFTTSGNLWARIPQLRLDGAIDLGSTTNGLRLIWVAALVASVQADAIPSDQASLATIRAPEGGERSLLPAAEARLAVAYGKSFELGISAHLGDRKIAFTGGDNRQRNGAIALDLMLPLPANLALKGEAFWGTGLDAFFGGIGQGIAHTVDASGAITSLGDGIASFGGWGQASWTGSDWLSLYGGGGLDHPKKNDLLRINASTNRTLNMALYGEVAIELARGCVIWLEYDFVRTKNEAAPTERSHTISLTGALTF
jgi:hypothetical protein